MQFFEGTMVFFDRMVRIFSRYANFFGQGVQNTLILAVFTVLIGTVLGTFLAIMRMSAFKPARWFSVAYIEFIRGTPLMIQLMFLFYGLPMLGIKLPKIDAIPSFDRFVAGVIAMSINSSAYVAEIIRSGIQAVDRGQTEAAQSLGFRNGQTLSLVVLPQAIKNILPALGNEFVTIIKESSLTSVIGIADLMHRTNGVIANTYIQLESLTIAALIYFILTFATSQFIAFAERRMANGSR